MFVVSTFHVITYFKKFHIFVTSFDERDVVPPILLSTLISVRLCH